MTTKTEIENQAAEWLVRRDRGEESPSERLRFEQWLAADASHRSVYLALQATWQQADQLKGWIPHRGPVDPSILRGYARRGAGLKRAPWVSYALAATVLLAVLSAAGVYWVRSPATYSTDVGGYERVVLADGSVLQLNTDSKARVRFTAAVREVELVRGEAFFQVARDSARPFLVTAADKAVRALGTAFSVRMKDAGNLEVTVTEGKVSVDSGQPDRPSSSNVVEPVVLVANQVASLVESKVSVSTVSRPEATRRVAWRTGELSFQGETLATVVAEFNRYNERHLEIADAALAELQVGGNFQATDLDSFTAALERSFEIRAERDGERIRLVR